MTKKDGYGHTIIGQVGDVNPLDHSGGIVIQGEHEPELEYTWGLEGLGGDVPEDESAAVLEVYRVPIEKDLVKSYDWVDWPDVARTIGMPLAELMTYGRDSNVMARASTIEAIASHYGWGELDSYPLIMSYAELEARWFPDEAINPKEYVGAVSHPGKFENEPPWVPHFYEQGPGWAEDEGTWPAEGEGWAARFKVTERDRVAFPDLTDRKIVGIYERSDGFVIGLDADGIRELLEDMEKANAEAEQD